MKPSPLDYSVPPPLAQRDDARAGRPRLSLLVTAACIPISLGFLGFGAGIPPLLASWLVSVAGVTMACVGYTANRRSAVLLGLGNLFLFVFFLVMLVQSFR